MFNEFSKFDYCLLITALLLNKDINFKRKIYILPQFNQI